jgi:hypothetical protein
MRRLVVHMREGAQHVLDFERDEDAAAALQELNDALAARGQERDPVTIAGRLVVRPVDVRSAELSDPPRSGAVFA